MRKANQPKKPKKSFDLNLCVDPRLAKHLEVLKKEVHNIVKDHGDSSPGMLIHNTTEIAGGVLAYTTYIKGTTVILVHPVTEDALIESAFMAFRTNPKA